MSESPDDSDSNEIEVEPEEPVRRDLTITDGFALGSNTSYLRLAGNHNYYLGKVGEGYILEALENVQNTLIETQTAVHVAQRIDEFKRILYNQYEGESATTRIDEDLGDELMERANRWQDFINEAIAEERRLNIPSSGILDFEQLMYNPHSMFQQETWEAMDERPKKDFAEACRTLPIECPTATVMMSLRAVEHYLRKWQNQEIGEAVEQESMGSVLDSLIEEHIDEQDKKGPVIQQLSGVPSVLSNILYLKDKRNKVNHPDERPTRYEAAITLFMVAGTISEVCEVIGEVEN